MRFIVTVGMKGHPNVTDFPMTRVGYARVSTSDQDLDIQVGRLKAAGCEIVRQETGSGTSRSGRTELETIMQFLRTGDELVVLRLDRLGRSTRDVLNLVYELDEKGASLRVLRVSVRCDRSDEEVLLPIMSMLDNGHLEALDGGPEGAEEAVLV